MKVCPKCNEKFDSGKFCKYCGGALVEEAGATQELRCVNCGKTLEAGTMFCPACGTKVTVQEEPHCASCGAVLKEGAKFCPKCGTKVSVQEELHDVGCETASSEEPKSSLEGDDPISCATDNSGNMAANFVKVSTGTFPMGCRKKAHPVHNVTLTQSFEMCDHVVTQGEWKAVMGGLPYLVSGDKEDFKPVHDVSWYDAVNYCNSLSELVGLAKAYTVNGTDVMWNKDADGYRLPTEAEWEYAARGGKYGVKATHENVWSGTASENSLGEYAWYNENSDYEIHDVKTKKPNALGLYDMSGNVWEWCWDWYAPYSSGAMTNPLGAPSGSRHVLRGGSCYTTADNCSVSCRDDRCPEIASEDRGFRVVRSCSGS